MAVAELCEAITSAMSTSHDNCDSLVPFASSQHLALQVAGKDWSETKLGNRNNWPRELDVAVEFCLRSRFPTFICWGEELSSIQNAACASMLPARFGHALGTPAATVWHDAWPAFYAHVEAVLGRGESTWQEDFEVDEPGAGRLQLTMSCTPLTDNDGKVGGLMCVCRDETERIGKEKALAELRRKLDSAMIAGEIGTFEWDIGTDRLWGDANFAKMFNIALDATGAAPLSAYIDAIHPDDRERVGRLIKESVRTGKGYEAQYRIISCTELRWVVARGKIETDGAGRALRFPGVVLDVTERRRSEEALQRNVMLLKAISDTTGDVIFAKDRNGRLIYANPATLALVGKPLDQVLGKTDAEVLDDKEAARVVMLNDQRVMHQAKQEDLEELVPLPDGTHRIWFSRKIPYRDDDGNVIGLLGVSRDITERKYGEEERNLLLESERNARADVERANRLKDEFLATLSHELRTPLNAILGWADLLARHRAAPDKAAEVIYRNARIQARLIEDLLDMSRIVSGKLELTKSALDLRDSVQAAADNIRHAADTKGIGLEVVCGAEPLMVMGDAGRLGQAILNLADNAIKFTPPGGKVRIGLAGGAQHAEMVIEDNGGGIDPAFLPFLFDRFRQADASTTRIHGGLGLGLSIVKQIMELHGGSVRAESAGVGKGARFTLTFPLLEPEPAERRTHQQSGERDLRGVSLILVDDDVDANDFLKQYLEERGAEVRAFHRADDAFAELEGWVPHAIISDISMPGKDGYSFIRAVRGLSETHRTLPAIALTAFARAEDEQKALRAGFSAHLAKPVERSRLLDLIVSATSAPPGAGGRASPALHELTAVVPSPPAST
jgi:PAS domain S-box-containing protein